MARGSEGRRVVSGVGEGSGGAWRGRPLTPDLLARPGGECRLLAVASSSEHPNPR